MTKQSLVPKITEAKSYQEAIQVLNVRKAPSIFKSALDLLFKIDTSQPAGRTYQGQMLQEMENDLKKHEEEEEKHAMKEMEMNDEEHKNGKKEMHEMHEMKNDHNMHQKKPGYPETEGNPSSGPEHPKEYKITDSKFSGADAQSDGSSVEDQIDKAEDTGEGSQPAQAQPGESQLKEAIKQVADMGTVDPRSTAVIDYMGRGMSQVEASNAANADSKMMEAIFDVKFKEIGLPILQKILGDYTKLQETIRVVDQKHEAKKPTGYSEVIQIPVAPGVAPQKQMNRFEETSPEDIRKDITSKYLADMYS